MNPAQIDEELLEIETCKAKLNVKIKSLANLKEQLQKINVELAKLRKIKKKLKKDITRLKKLLFNRQNLYVSIRNENDTIRELKRVIRNSNRKLCKTNIPIRNKFIRRVNVNNEQQLNHDDYKKQIKIRKQECIDKRKNLYTRNRKNKRGKRNKRGNRCFDQLRRNKINYKYKGPTYKNIKEFIKHLYTILKKIIMEVNNECLAYDTQIKFSTIMYSISRVISTNETMSTVNQHLKNKNIAYVFDETLNKKRRLIDYNYFRLIYEKLIEIIIVDIQKCSNTPIIELDIYSTDGTKLAFMKNLINDNFSTDNRGNYCKGLLNCIYNNTNELPIDIILDNGNSESKLLIKQLDKIPRNSTLLADGHYFTDKVLKKLDEKGIYFIFKTPRNLTICREFLESNNNSMIYNYCGTNVRLIKYKNNTETLVLGTNLFDQNEYPDKLIIELFKQRWFIEEYFKIAKCVFNLKKTTAKTKNTILQEFYMQMIIVALSKYIEIIAPTLLINDKNYETYKINKKNMLINIANDILYKLLFKKLTKRTLSDISNILFDLINSTTLIEDNRYELRKRKLPVTEFSNNTNYDHG